MSDIEIYFPLFLQLFKGREEFFAQQGIDYYHPVNKSLNEYYLAHHLNGDATFGIYLLDKDSYCHLFCFDLDIPKSELESIYVNDTQNKYHRLAPQLNGLLSILIDKYKIPNEAILVEDTGGRGFHIWVFLSHAIPGSLAIVFGENIKKQVEFTFEFYPKQGRLTAKRKYGNLIKLPLGIHRTYQSRSRFITLSPEGPVVIDTLDANLELLTRIEPADSLLISSAADTFQVELQLRDEFISDATRESQRNQYLGDPSTLVSRCTAIRLLSEKAESGIPFNQKEAFHFANIMLSTSGGVNEIHRVMKLSYGEKYNPARTNSEIENILPLFPSSCRTLVDDSICPQYCKQSVKKQNEDPLLSNTIPCSVWLKREETKKLEVYENIVEIIGRKENIQDAFYKIKRYSQEEPSIFLDPFDFDIFEERLNELSQIIAEIFSQQVEINRTGFLPFKIPKKLNDNFELQYRRMTYMSVFDQVPIQSIFNILGPLIDSNFHNGSYGYRWNKDTSVPYRNFEDWRISYPRFRGNIIKSLKENPTGYYICCDIKGYYDNVNQEILIQQLRNIIEDEYIYKCIEQLIYAYVFQKGFNKGIPQGPAYAPLLANLYLNDFDKFISRYAAGYFRYVDDFVLVFDTRRSAEVGLKKIVENLAKYDLELSIDKDKKPEIIQNLDLTRMRKTLDKIRYGILENTKQIKYLDIETINDFYDTVERHSVTFDSPEKLIKINTTLPSLLYVVSQEHLIPHPLCKKLITIIYFLIQKKWFFPKRLGIVFSRLLKMESDKSKLISIYSHLVPTHKCFFLLTVYTNWLADNKEYQQMLEDLLHKSLDDDDFFVFGLSISIILKTGIYQKMVFDINPIFDRLEKTNNWYELIRFFSEIDYLTFDWNGKERIRKIFKNKSFDLLIYALLAKLSDIPRIQVDEIFISDQLSEFKAIILPAACSLFRFIENQSFILAKILDYLSLAPTDSTILSRVATRPTRKIIKRRDRWWKTCLLAFSWGGWGNYNTSQLLKSVTEPKKTNTFTPPRHSAWRSLDVSCIMD